VNGCWIWTRPSKRNTAHVWFEHRNWSVPRLIWTVTTGDEPPPDKYVVHDCGNRLCCNPRHMYLGTAAESGATGGSKTLGRKRPPMQRLFCRRGHRLTPDNVYVSYWRGTAKRRCRICATRRRQGRSPTATTRVR
jgi:hypothetical protein